MKNSNNKQDRKFEKQVSHLQSFIGMPLWNGRSPSLSEIREYDRRLLEKQALGFEPKRKSLLSRLIASMMRNTSKAFARIETASINKPDIAVKTSAECCG